MGALDDLTKAYVSGRVEVIKPATISSVYLVFPHNPSLNYLIKTEQAVVLTDLVNVTINDLQQSNLEEFVLEGSLLVLLPDEPIPPTPTPTPPVPPTPGASIETYIKTVNAGTWLGSAPNYYKDIVHNFGTLNISVTAYNPASSQTELVGVERIDANTARILVDTIGITLIISVLKLEY